MDPYGLFIDGGVITGPAAYFVATALAAGILYYGAPIAADVGQWLGNWMMSGGASSDSPNPNITPGGTCPNGDDENPRRITNRKHHPNSESPEPRNAQELFDNSIVDRNGVRWAKDADGIIHRFSKPSNGESHWNGSTGGVKPIRANDIPIDIRRILK